MEKNTGMKWRLGSPIGFPKIRGTFWGTYTMEHGICGYIWVHPYLWKLPDLKSIRFRNVHNMDVFE